jgi:hypothetical protein
LGRRPAVDPGPAVEPGGELVQTEGQQPAFAGTAGRHDAAEEDRRTDTGDGEERDQDGQDEDIAVLGGAVIGDSPRTAIPTPEASAWKKMKASKYLRLSLDDASS